MVLGKVTEVNPCTVEKEAVDNLRKLLRKPAEGFSFDCWKCGAERRANVIDPGVLQRLHDCSEVGELCGRPETRPILFVPGSLVMAPIDPLKDAKWPGIIEPCPEWPELTEGHLIRSRRQPNNARAYYVTFIFPGDKDRKLYGGFIEARLVSPFPENWRSLRISEDFDRREFRDSLRIAADATHLSLADRLLRFSVVSHAADLRNVYEAQIQCESDDSKGSDQLPKLFESPCAKAPNRSVLERDCFIGLDDDDERVLRTQRIKQRTLTSWLFPTLKHDDSD